MHKKRIIIILMGLILIVIGIKMNTKNTSDIQKFNNTLAVMLEQEDGSYTLSTLGSLNPDGAYTMNTEKSYCENGSQISWDGTSISFLGSVADKCTLYFDQSLSYITLSALGLEDQVQSTPTDYNMFDYTYNGYQQNYVWDTENEWFKSSITQKEGVNTSGIYSMEDDYGISYYFRGPKSLNNIVKFGTYDEDMYYYETETGYTTGNLTGCQSEATNSTTYCTDKYKYASAGNDMYWRIVRINGDGSLRLIYIGTEIEATELNSSAGKSSFNQTDDDPKYAGYTYDNSSPNVQDGTSSDIKNYLEKWYNKNMMDEDANIIYGQFFNDTTKYEENESMGTWWTESLGTSYPVWTSALRLARGVGTTPHAEPTLKTSITDKTYGGVYYLKVGLINADEITLSGADGVYGAYGTNEYNSVATYTTFADFYWSISPALFHDFVGIFIIDDHIGDRDAGSLSHVIPVINLAPETAQSLIGTGSTTDYYRLN